MSPPGSRSRSVADSELARRPDAPVGGKAAATVPIGAGPPSERRRQWRGPAGRGDSVHTGAGSHAAHRDCDSVDPAEACARGGGATPVGKPSDKVLNCHYLVTVTPAPGSPEDRPEA
jgi:hypothetical protein